MRKKIAIISFLMIITVGLGFLLSQRHVSNEDIKSYQTALLEAKGHYDGLERDINYLRSTDQVQFIPRIVNHRKTIIEKMREWAGIILNDVPPEIRTLLQKVG